MNITTEIETNKLGDSYVIKEEYTRQTSCFSSFNCGMTSETSDNVGSIILEKDKIDQLGMDDVKFFLENIKMAGTLDFKVIEKKDELHLEFDSKDSKKKSYYQYTGMLIRCSYKNRNDNFIRIGKHFIQMCKYYPEVDRGQLITLACNLYLADLNNGLITDIKYYSYNSNHILMYNSGCKILTTKEIKELLDLNTGINENFTLCDKSHDPTKVYITNENGLKVFNKDNPRKYDPKSFNKELFEIKTDSKRSYSKILKLNGIK
jgi:hypothetical protein